MSTERGTKQRRRLMADCLKPLKTMIHSVNTKAGKAKVLWGNEDRKAFRQIMAELMFCIIESWAEGTPEEYLDGDIDRLINALEGIEGND